MAEIVLFHHAQGLTPGVTAFADELRQAGHIVHTPDLFDGRWMQPPAKMLTAITGQRENDRLRGAGQQYVAPLGLFQQL